MSKGKESGKGKFGEDTKHFKKAAAKAQSWAKKYKKPEEIPASVIPNTWDFRNIEGYDFTGHLRDQGWCGSCYTMAFVQVMESRLKLKYANKMKEDLKSLSPQHLLVCNYLTDGCQGGWTSYHGFFTENAHLTTEECAPYKGKTNGDHCGNYEKCPPIARNNKTYYVGDYHLRLTQEQIQQELLMHGPVTTSVMAGGQWGNYKEGIMEQEPVPYTPEKGEGYEYHVFLETDAEEGAEAQTTMPTQEVNHAVLIIGWSEEPETKKKYWIVRNSQSSDFGISGDFHVRMGRDDYGIESEVAAFQPELIQHDHDDKEE